MLMCEVRILFLQVFLFIIIVWIQLNERKCNSIFKGHNEKESKWSESILTTIPLVFPKDFALNQEERFPLTLAHVSYWKN